VADSIALHFPFVKYLKAVAWNRTLYMNSSLHDANLLRKFLPILRFSITEGQSVTTETTSTISG
jgi:hypothetical protein